MTKNQEDSLTMSQTTIAFLLENESIWKGNPYIAGLITDLGKKNDELVDDQAEQEKSHTGITEKKQDDRTGTEDDIHIVSNVLSFFAAMTGDIPLKGVVKPGTIDLSDVSGEKLVGVAKTTLQEGTDHLSAATPFGLTQDMLTSLDGHLEGFVKMINAPRIAITTAAVHTDAIAVGISYLNQVYKDKLDKGMVMFKNQVNFYNQYKKVRVKVHSPTHHIAATALFTGADGSPLENVKITIVNGDEKVLRKSTPKGNIRVQNLLPGDHVLVAEKPGYEKVEMPFLVSEPDTTRLEVVMKMM